MPCDNPRWLQGGPSLIGKLPLHELLSCSVFYPASRFDGEPVEILGREYCSFVYADYGVAQRSVVNQLWTFNGYRPLAYREVEADELMPYGLLELPPATAEWIALHPGWLNPDFFALWAVLQRLPGFGRDHGPERLSLLYVRYEGVTTFNSLYRMNGVTPGAVAIIQPVGGNWTDFRDPEQPLAQAVLTNPAGVPSCLFCDGEEQPYWPIYPALLGNFGNFKVWGLVNRPFHPWFRP
jgi:hypothetical protein